MRPIGFFRIWTGCAAAAALLGLVHSAWAQDPAANYPNKPIRLIVPFAAGGGNDIFARLVTAKASEYLGQQFVIENRAAAGGRRRPNSSPNQLPMATRCSSVQAVSCRLPRRSIRSSPIIRPGAFVRSR